MGEFAYFSLISVAMFAGAVVSGTVGFGFSAIAGAIMLHVMPPIEAVPLLMACGVLVQVSSLLALIRSMEWRRSFGFIAGGMLGVAPAVYLLRHLDTDLFRVLFGGLIAAYAAYMLLRCAAPPKPRRSCTIGDGLVGFGGGLIGGLTAMPAALPSIWCDLRGVPKGEQRGVVQPFILLMQGAALLLLAPYVTWTPTMMVDLTISLPALAAGTALGVLLFSRVDNARFRRVVLGTLLVSGLVLAV